MRWPIPPPDKAAGACWLGGAVAGALGLVTHMWWESITIGVFAWLGIWGIIAGD